MKALTAVITLLALLALGYPALAQHLFVDDIGDGAAGAGTADSPYRDLQAAIDLAPDGATVIVLPGRYEAAPRDMVEPIAGNELEPATPLTIADAWDFIDPLNASGKTDIYKSLEPLMTLGTARARPFLILLYSDGRPTLGVRNSRAIINRRTITGMIMDRGTIKSSLRINA